MENNKTVDWHIKTINKLFEIVKSCKTISQYNMAMILIYKYSANRWRGAGVTNLMAQMQDYALLKGKLIYLNTITNEK